MRTCPYLLCLVVLLPAVAGCGARNRLAVGAMVPILDQAFASSFRDNDLETTREAIPGSLLLLRGLCDKNPKDRELAELGAQSYFSFAMAFIEDIEPERASLLYAEGLRLGRQALESRGWFREAESTRPLPAAGALEEIGRGDIPLLFWTLANWARWVGMHLDDPAALAQLPRVEAYLQRVLELEPDYYFGMPHVMLGVLQAARPKMLGGDLEGSRGNFEAAGRISKGRMLIFEVLYAQYYCRQALDEDCFDQKIDAVLEAPDNLFPDYELWNLVAKEKAAFLREMRDEFF